MVSITIDLPEGANPNVVGPTIVGAVLTIRREEFMIEVASGLLVDFWEATYDQPYSDPLALSADDLREKAEFLRVQPQLSMNQIFEQFGMLRNCAFSESRLARGEYVVPITVMEDFIKDVLEQRDQDDRERCSSSKPKRHPHK